MAGPSDSAERVATLADVQAAGRLVVQARGHAVVLFAVGERVFALDNRCPHMGFPLHRGTLHDGILTCHWHHARFDLASGGTFDRFADDVRTFPVRIQDGEVWVDLAPRVDLRAHQRERLREGLEYEIPLVTAKAVIGLLEAGESPDDPLRIGLEFGAWHRRNGWGRGQTILACMRNLLPHLRTEDQARALYHGLSAVAEDCAGAPPRFVVRPLPVVSVTPAALKQWYRQFIEVRDAEGAERCVVSAVHAGVDHQQMADMLFAAATDHRYLEVGHVLDFTNKALEALDAAGWQYAEPVLVSLVAGCASADRMEESNAWRHPVDLVAILEGAFEEMPAAVQDGRSRRGGWPGRDILLDQLLGEDPRAIADGLLAALRDGASEDELASSVAYAAALRIARFHTSNEFGDWDTALHTFTFANAVQQGLRRVPSVELLRGVFDAAMSVYLDRFLNVPPAPLPEPDGGPPEDADGLLASLPTLLDRQQQVNEAGALVGRYLYSGGSPERLLETLTHCLLREDRNFHTIQAVEAAARQFTMMRGRPEAGHALIAAARYLAAHAPTVRAQGQTYQIAHRLHRGERLYAAPERVLATVLFTDVVESTAKASAVGDQRWGDLLRNYRAVVRAELARFQGREVDVAGDGFLVTFDGAARAIRCALAVGAAVRRLGLETRSGLHAGEIEVMGDRVSGIVVHTGARVAALADPGQVLVTSTVRELVAGSGFAFDDRGLHTLRGVPGDWRLFQVG
jgi:class 3 adenylate cyclase/nitrite reductase/ring-hydroxylating ferredoxin subunit